jgi:hypothetical protein
MPFERMSCIGQGGSDWRALKAAGVGVVRENV